MVYFKFEFGLGKNKKPSGQNTAMSEMNGWDFVQAEVEKVKAEGRFKTASNYLTAVRSWSKFIASDWRFSEMDAPTMEKYQRWLCNKGICMNTVSAYMRALRTLYNRATFGKLQEDGVDLHPFAKVFTGRAKTVKRSISELEIQRLRSLVLLSNSSLALARDIFLFSFYAMGMPFVDIAYLKKEQVQDGFIQYARHKTGQRISVAVEAPMLEIINRYENPRSDYVFPILTEQKPELLHRQYQRSLRRYNYSLKRLSDMINSSRPLSSYVVRHSWASLAYLHHIDIGLIGKALGHTKASTTLLYIKNLFDPDLADANHSLIMDLGL